MIIPWVKKPLCVESYPGECKGLCLGKCVNICMCMFKSVHWWGHCYSSEAWSTSLLLTFWANLFHLPLYAQVISHHHGEGLEITDHLVVASLCPQCRSGTEEMLPERLWNEGRKEWTMNGWSWGSWLWKGGLLSLLLSWHVTWVSLSCESRNLGSAAGPSSDLCPLHASASPLSHRTVITSPSQSHYWFQVR